MRNKPELTLAFLLIAALCLEALITDKTVYCPGEKMTWPEARLFCQKNYIDLVTWNTVNRFWLAKWLLEIKVQKVWIGLLRDPEHDSVWKWIDVRTGEGISGDDLSLSPNWADGQQSSHCALVQDSDQMWHSDTCSSEHHFYCSSVGVIEHLRMNYSWYRAQQYCQHRFDDLATVTKTTTDQFDSTGWIGLHQEAGETWSWSGDLTSDYRNWAPGQPLTTDCGSFDPVTEQWYSNQCSKELRPVCYDDNLVVVKKNRTWEEALAYCRSIETACADSQEDCMYRYELLSLENKNEYNYVRERIYRATTNEVWTGLRFLQGEWWWVHGQVLDHQGLLLGCPSQWKHCGTLSKYDGNNWLTRDCSERRNFVCYKREVSTDYERGLLQDV